MTLLNFCYTTHFEPSYRLTLTESLSHYNHTLYLSFLLHRQDFRKPNFTPKKTTKITKNTKNVSEKVKYMHFFHSIWKNLHLTENFYTDTICGVCDKYEVCSLDQGGGDAADAARTRWNIYFHLM